MPYFHTFPGGQPASEPLLDPASGLFRSVGPASPWPAGAVTHFPSAEQVLPEAHCPIPHMPSQLSDPHSFPVQSGWQSAGL
jgi:hypothetical protein